MLQPIDKWEMCLHHRYPASIAWEEFVANQAQLYANSLNESRGATGDGTQRPSVAARDRALWAVRSLTASALLWSRGANFLSIVVVPTRASLEEQTGNPVRALALDTQVEQRFLEALRPDQLTLALAALAQLEQEEQAESKQWELRLERARYQAKRAERQYQAVEPENRLVARSLERQWEEQLRAVETVEKEYHAWKSSRFGSFTQADREAIVALGSDLPTRLPSTHDHQY